MKKVIALSFLLLSWCQIILAQIINEPDFEPLYPCEGDGFPGLKAAVVDSYKVGIIYIQFADWQTNRAAQGGIKKIRAIGDTSWYSYRDYWLMTFSDHEYQVFHRLAAKQEEFDTECHRDDADWHGVLFPL